MNSIEQAKQLGQAIWLDYIRRGLITSGELQRYIDQGISGITSNPTIFEKAMVGSSDYDELIVSLVKARKSNAEIYESIVVEDIQIAADMLRPLYNQTSGLHGYVSLEVNPALAYDMPGTIKEAKRLFSILSRPNIMIKIPATQEGTLAIRHLIREGVNVNATLIFSLAAYQEVMEAYISGIEDLIREGGDASQVTSVASFFLSRIDTAIDNLLKERIKQGQKELAKLLGQTAITSAKLAYQAFKQTFTSERFQVLRNKGALVQRPLWASTGTKNPSYSDVLYVEKLIGADTVNTMPPATISAFLDHGRVSNTIEMDLPESHTVWAEIAIAGISVDAVTSKLFTDGVKAFAASFDKLMTSIEEKRTQILMSKHVIPGANFGDYQHDVEVVLTGLKRTDVVPRIWQKDYTVWKPEPMEISNRLGWLDSPQLMLEHVPELESFAQEVTRAGFRHIVLLGMGGSSLGSEVLRQVFSNLAGHPEVIVLDSVVPARIESVRESIDLVRTIFLVSSKSGTTTEPLSLFRYFKDLIEMSVGKGQAGQNFVAITDPGTPLEELAIDEGFRRIFINPPDIGGRYSVLSYFGLVPASLLGIGITQLLERANHMLELCNPDVPIAENPGAWLGAFLGAMTKAGRDKLTLITSPSVSSFGLWVEQLIAESTGKEGKGIIPVTTEPLLDPSYYESDRMFVYLRLREEETTEIDRTVEQIGLQGHPVITLEMSDRYDLAAEFFRWEFATAVAGVVLGIHPFNQPDVQRAKDATQRVLRNYIEQGRLPIVRMDDDLPQLLAGAKKGDYLAIMAYINQTEEVDQVLADFRRKITENYRIVTTLGYGPRFLHSTGQLHKGGPNTGLFIQITSKHHHHLPIPGKPYSFGIVADAQALGDFEALQSMGRRIIRIQAAQDNAAGISKLINNIT